MPRSLASAETLLRARRQPAVETRRCEAPAVDATEYEMRVSAFILKHGKSEVSVRVSVSHRAKRKRTGAMAGQTDNPHEDTSRARAHRLLVKYENARGSTEGAWRAGARSAVLETPQSTVHRIRRSVAVFPAIGFALVGEGKADYRSPLINDRSLRDVVRGQCAVVRSYGAKKMAGREASPSAFRRMRLHLTWGTRSRLSVAYEIAIGLTDAETIVYPRKRGRRHLPLGIGVSKCTRRTTADRRYFFVRCHAFAFNGRALVGERSRSPVSLYAGTPTLSCAWPPQLALGARFVEPVQGGLSMRPAIPARSEQRQSLLQIQIINRALRDAALAPSANEALDCCADALLHLAELARAEVAHG